MRRAAPTAVASVRYARRRRSRHVGPGRRRDLARVVSGAPGARGGVGGRDPGRRASFARRLRVRGPRADRGGPRPARRRSGSPGSAAGAAARRCVRQPRRALPGLRPRRAGADVPGQRLGDAAQVRPLAAPAGHLVRARPRARHRQGLVPDRGQPRRRLRALADPARQGLAAAGRARRRSSRSRAGPRARSGLGGGPRLARTARRSHRRSRGCSPAPGAGARAAAVGDRPPLSALSGLPRRRRSGGGATASRPARGRAGLVP